MGCRQSHLKYTNNLSDNENVHDENDEHKLSEVDSRLPLDARQVFKLKQSWKGIKRKIEEAGVEMFVRYERLVLFAILSYNFQLFSFYLPNVKKNISVCNA